MLLTIKSVFHQPRLQLAFPILVSSLNIGPEPISGHTNSMARSARREGANRSQRNNIVQRTALTVNPDSIMV